MQGHFLSHGQEVRAHWPLTVEPTVCIPFTHDRQVSHSGQLKKKRGKGNWEIDCTEVMYGK